MDRKQAEKDAATALVEEVNEYAGDTAASVTEDGEIRIRPSDLLKMVLDLQTHGQTHWPTTAQSIWDNRVEDVIQFNAIMNGGE